jgi:hypothetical protein
MSVNTTLAGISQTASSNGPDGTTDAPSTLDDALRYALSFTAQLRDGKGFTAPVTLASASTTDIGAQNSFAVEISGTTTITSFGTNYTGPRFLRFTGALTLTHNATTLNLPGGANITTAAGDTCIAYPNSSANGWNVLVYQFATGQKITGTLAVTGAATVSSTLGVTGQVNANGGIAVTGAATVSTNLTVTSIATATGGLTVGTGSLTAKSVLYKSSGDGLYMHQGYTDGAEQYRVENNGAVKNATNSYGAISDARLKENIADATPKLAALQKVRVVNYNLIGGKDKQIGVIAQELEQIFPGLVDTDKNGMKSVKYSVLVPILVKAVQELSAKVEALSTEHREP